MRRSFSFLTAVTVVAIVVVLFAGSAYGKSAPTTKMRFKLTDHSVAVGDTLSASLTVSTHGTTHGPEAHGGWMPMEGVTVSITIDKVEVGTVVTDAEGHADVVVVATEAGDHVLRAVFAGDELHKKAQRAQGFSVEEAPAPAPEPDPAPEA